MADLSKATVLCDRSSPIFGEYRDPTALEDIMINLLVLSTPVRLFQQLNKALNKRGMCLRIDKLTEYTKEDTKGEEDELQKIWK